MAADQPQAAPSTLVWGLADQRRPTLRVGARSVPADPAHPCLADEKPAEARKTLDTFDCIAEVGLIVRSGPESSQQDKAHDDHAKQHHCPLLGAHGVEQPHEVTPEMPHGWLLYRKVQFAHLTT